MTQELVKEEAKSTNLIAFSVTDAAIAEMKLNYMAIVVTGHNDKENSALARTARLDVKEKRIAVEKKRKELKSEALAYGKSVDAKAKLIFDALEPIEKHLQAQEDIVKLREQKQEEEAAAERQRNLEAEIKLMEEEKAQMVADRLSLAQEKQKLIDDRAKIELEKTLREEAEANRIADDLRNAQAIIKMAEQAEADKVMIAAQVEADKLKAEQDTKDAAELAEKNRVIALEQAKKDIKQAADDANAKAVREAAELAESIRVAEELRLQVIENNRVEAERKAALAPDKEKLIKLGKQIASTPMPEVGADAQKIIDQVVILLGKVETYINTSADKL